MYDMILVFEFLLHFHDDDVAVVWRRSIWDHYGLIFIQYSLHFLLEAAQHQVHYLIFVFVLRYDLVLNPDSLSQVVYAPLEDFQALQFLHEVFVDLHRQAHTVICSLSLGSGSRLCPGSGHLSVLWELVLFLYQRGLKCRGSSFSLM